MKMRDLLPRIYMMMIVTLLQDALGRNNTEFLVGFSVGAMALVLVIQEVALGQDITLTDEQRKVKPGSNRLTRTVT